MKSLHTGVKYGKLSADSHDEHSEKVTLMLQSLPLFLGDQFERLVANGSPERKGKNHVPVLYLSVKGLDHKFLLTELNPEKPEIAFGLCEEYSGITLADIDLMYLHSLAYKNNQVVRSNSDIGLKYNLEVYRKVASELGSIVVDDGSKPLQELFATHNTNENSDPDKRLVGYEFKQFIPKKWPI